MVVNLSAHIYRSLMRALCERYKVMCEDGVDITWCDTKFLIKVYVN